ncbi:MAG: TadE/TadG family type IV pilus assembly protein [Allosphingosinicella sp.]
MRALRRTARVPLLRDSRGVSVIEFGLLAPVLAFIMLGIIDLSTAYARKMAIEQAVHRALEKAAVGTVQDDYSFLETEVKSALPDLPSTGVTVTSWKLCDTAVSTVPCGFRADGTAEETSRYVKIAVVDRWKPSFPYGLGSYRFFNIGTDGKIPLKAETSLRVQ